MKAIYQIFGTYNLAVAVVLGLYIAVGHWFPDPGFNPFDIINPLMAIAIVVALLASLRRKLRMKDDGEVSREYLEVNLLFYASVILVIIFFSNWFYVLYEIDEASDSSRSRHSIYWWFINPLFILVSGIKGYHLWRDSSSE